MYTSPMNIAYAAHDQTIRVHDLAEPDVSDRVLSVPGLRCTWPLVSPGGDLVAFSGYAGGSNGSAHLGLYATGIDSRGPGLIYANEPGSDGIARGTPHYSCWSPDGSKLAFIAQTARGLTLFVWNADSGESPRALLDGGPMYFSWSNTSDELFVHSFTGHYLVDVSSDEGDASPEQFPGLSTQYMSPSWDKTRRRIAFFLDAEQRRQRLVTIDLEDQAVRVQTEISGIASLAWRPRSSQLGIARTMIGSSGFYSGLHVIDCDTREERQIVDDPMLAFYWSHDGSRVAYVTSSEGAEGSLRIGVATVDDGSVVYLPDFRPSQEQLTHFMFFDQYAQSLPLWSPDDRSLLVFGELGYHVERTPLSSGDDIRAIVLDAAGEREPREVAGGFIGCWLG